MKVLYEDPKYEVDAAISRNMLKCPVEWDAYINHQKVLIDHLEALFGESKLPVPKSTLREWASVDEKLRHRLNMAGGERPRLRYVIGG